MNTRKDQIQSSIFMTEREVSDLMKFDLFFCVLLKRRIIQEFHVTSGV